MEQEKLDEARRFLEEDREKFEKLMDDSDRMVKKIDGDVKSKVKEKKELTRDIEQFTIKIQVKDGTIKKIDDDLVLFKRNKHFMDILAIQAGLKKYQKIDDREEQNQETGGRGKKSLGKRAMTYANTGESNGDSSTFLTGLG